MGHWAKKTELNMKKTYIEPELEVVVLSSMGSLMVASSVSLSDAVQDIVTDPSDQLAPELNLIYE